MAEDAEGRFKRAMDRLFSSPAAPSDAGRDSSKIGTISKPVLKTHTRNLLSGEFTPYKADSAPSLHQVCRPWDRGDLFRRLATFKSMTWFGKPEVAGPVNCARNGWVNVDVDLIACEGCSAMLSFPCPPTWSQHEVDSAAAVFSEKLESGHTALCPWKDNACSETLAQFPPTPVEVLVGGFQDRCDALHQLSALPALSSSTIDYLKASRGPQMELFLARPAPNFALVDGSPEVSPVTTYFQTQRIISLCGWELRLLPYVVDCEDDNTESLRNRTTVADSKARNTRLTDSGPRVLLYSSKRQKVDQNEEGEIHSTNQEEKRDLGSAVFDCSLCGASVGLWLFSKIPCPSSRARVESLIADTGSVVCEFSAASEIQKVSGDDNWKESKATGSAKVEDVATSNLLKVKSKPANVLILNLTIAGGPRPTTLQSAGSKSTKISHHHDVQTGSMIGEGKCGAGMISKKRKRDGASVGEVEAMEHNVRMLPDLSSVNAVDTCFACHPENSAESVEMPSKQPKSTLMYTEHNDILRSRCLSDETATEHAISCKAVDTCNNRSNLTSHVETEHGIEGKASALPGGNVEGSKVGFEEKYHGNGINEPLHEEQATSLYARRSVEGSNREKICSGKELLDESAHEFDPILNHRHFCPWVNTNLGRGGCGWQLILEALEASPVAVKPESASSMYNVNPLSSVRKIFGKSQDDFRKLASG